MYAYTITNTAGRTATIYREALECAPAYRAFLKNLDIAALKVTRTADGHEMLSVQRTARGAINENVAGAVREVKPAPRAWNISTKKVGGLRFFKIGRINISVSVSRKA